ncbi:hypothetical protein OPT61_g5181 [Boeremia exigua]|uniref:Uncharacterized protein n=1 Tax=Boeremia exigua TaxID=749465 RepID=A0ACC2IB66_9PLEO|nr:hypothetical protein OPT61_g5181 [Boeremia exigua]
MSVLEKAAELGRRHPLQRLEAPSKGFSGALHNSSYGWHLQFLTIIGISLSTLCFAFGLAADLLSTTTPPPPPNSTPSAPPHPLTLSHHCFTAKNYLSLIAAPIEIVISILYWGLRLIDTSLVVPPDLPLPPLGADLCFHAVPAVVLALDAILLSPPWPRSPMSAQAPLITLGLSTGVAFAYWWWIRVGLFAVSGATMWVVGGALRAVYAFVNGYELTDALEKRQRARKMGSEGKWE